MTDSAHTWSRRLAIAGVAGAALLSACSIEPPLERRNPYDPHGIFELSLTGPDSSHYVGAVLQFTMHAEPALPSGDLIIHWDVFDDVSDGLGRPIPSTRVNPGPNETFVVRTATARYRRQTAVATFGENQFGWSWWLGQKVITLALTCPYAPGATDECPVPDDVTEFMLGATIADQAGSTVGEPAYAFARAQVTSRSPLVVAVVAAPAEPAPPPSGVRLARQAQAGSSWIVVDIDGAIDSIRVTVP